jgi:hypothetical protein
MVGDAAATLAGGRNADCEALRGLIKLEAPFLGLLGQWGPDALGLVLVASAVWMIFTGRMVTRREHDAMRQDRDYWREAHTTSEGTRSIMAQQMERLLENSEVANQVLTSLKKAADAE